MVAEGSCQLITHTIETMQRTRSCRESFCFGLNMNNEHNMCLCERQSEENEKETEFVGRSVREK